MEMFNAEHLQEKWDPILSYDGAPKIEDAQANIDDITAALASIEAENTDATLAFKKEAAEAAENHESSVAELKKAIEGASEEDAANFKAKLEAIEADYQKSVGDAENKESEREAKYQEQRTALLNDKADFEALVADETQELADEMKGSIDEYRNWSTDYAGIKDNFKDFYMRFYQYKYNNLSDKGEMLHSLVDKTFGLVGNAEFFGYDWERYNETVNRIAKLEEQVNDDVTPEDREDMLQKLVALKEELDNLINDAAENFERNKFINNAILLSGVV